MCTGDRDAMMSSGLGFRGKTIRDVESTCLPRMEFARRELEKTGWRNGKIIGALSLFP